MIHQVKLTINAKAFWMGNYSLLARIPFTKKFDVHYSGMNGEGNSYHNVLYINISYYPNGTVAGFVFA